MSSLKKGKILLSATDIKNFGTTGTTAPHTF